jgi:hypothetical protein
MTFVLNALSAKIQNPSALKQASNGETGFQ